MKPKQIFAVTQYNFRRWHKTPRIEMCIRDSPNRHIRRAKS